MKTKLSEVPKNAEITKAIEVFKNIYFTQSRKFGSCSLQNGKFTCSDAIGLKFFIPVW